MKRKVIVTVLIMSLFLMFLPTATVKAEEQETVEVGVQTMTYEGEVYELYAVEYFYPVSAMAEEEENGIRTEEEVTVYRYLSAARVGELMVAERVSDTYGSDGVKIATVKQVTEWSYRDGISVELISASTTVTYKHTAAMISMYSGDVYYDTTGNALYIYEYSVYYGSDIFNRRISTGCTIYGEIS
ncbi:MAG: hypothetical protein ACI4FZ_12905 [Lachnospiraceae bacterium]